MNRRDVVKLGLAAGGAGVLALSYEGAGQKEGAVLSRFLTTVSVDMGSREGEETELSEL